MFTFDHPLLFLLFFLPLLLKFIPRRKQSDAPEIIHPDTARLQRAFSSGQGGIAARAGWFVMLLWLIWSLLIITIMGPQTVDQSSLVKSKGYDIMLAVDLSLSMRALDFSSGDRQINRLDVVKQVVKDFVKKRQGDRVGLVLFGETAYLQVPLTLDTTAVGEMLNNAVTGMAGNTTAIGDAIGISVKNLRDRPEGSRVIILLTDGENTAGTVPPLDAAKIAKQYGIRIYTIGVGSTGPVPFPDNFGGIIMTEMNIDETSMREIAKTTGGLYFRATDSESLKNIYEKIDELEKTEAESKEFLIKNPLYRIPLTLAGLLLLLLAAIPVLKGRAKDVS